MSIGIKQVFVTGEVRFPLLLLSLVIMDSLVVFSVMNSMQNLPDLLARRGKTCMHHFGLNQREFLSLHFIIETLLGGNVLISQTLQVGNASLQFSRSHQQ